MYSDAQIANTLISQAAAVGADVPDATAFGNDNIQVDTSTPVYKMNKERDAKKKVTQSKSFQVSRWKTTSSHSLEIDSTRLDSTDSEH